MKSKIIINLNFRLLSVILVISSLNSNIYSQEKPDKKVMIKWLDTTFISKPCGVSWGVPWPIGKIQPNQVFSLFTDNGNPLPLQTWTMAYWPDGSVKWTGLATVTNDVNKNTYNLTLAADSHLIIDKNEWVIKSGDFLRINTGKLTCLIPLSGNRIIDSI